jgi:hypothetical protein
MGTFRRGKKNFHFFTTGKMTPWRRKFNSELQNVFEKKKLAAVKWEAIR